ncbi:MAG: hypothetical protein HOH33_14120 [Verrucomicrobia bacterium]|nr:hypothetical protein [Verrucomicrobiota bacterium]
MTIANLANVKLDYMLEYQPLVGGANTVGINQTAAFELPALFLADQYQLESSRSVEFTETEGGESGGQEFSYSGVGSYTVVQSSLFDNGGQAFRLAHNVPISSETLEWNRRFVVGNQASLSFRSRLGSAFEGEIATFQVSENEGQSWQTLWTQNGTSINAVPILAPSETVFTTRTMDLSEFEGKTISVRWVYAFTGGRVWVGSDEFAGVGWYFDTITAQGLSSLESELLPEQNEPIFQVAGGAEGSFSLRGRAFIRGEWRPWGEPAQIVVSNDVPSQLQVLNVTRNDSSLLIKVDVGGSGVAPVIESADSLEGPWLRGGAVSITSSAQSNVFDVTITIENMPAQFFRILPE